MHCRKGFTLIEIMVLVAVFGLLMAVSIPSINRYVRSNRLATSVDMMASDLKMVRSTAISRGSTLRLIADEVGYQVIDLSDGSTLLNRQHSGRVQMEGNLQVSFFPWGMADTGTINLGNGVGAGRSISILPTGVVEVN